jgi:hypothetical protein
MISIFVSLELVEILGITLSPLVRREIIGIVAVIITLIGMWLCWGATEYRMSIEERAKDGLISSEQAQRKIQFMQWFGPGVTAAGCVLLAFAVWD